MPLKQKTKVSSLLKLNQPHRLLHQQVPHQDEGLGDKWALFQWDWHSCIDITAIAYVWIVFPKLPRTMKMSIIKKKWKSVYEMYLKDTQARSHHSCILSRHVKVYKNLQCAAGRNKKCVPILAASVGPPLLYREKGCNSSFCHRLWLFYRGSRLLFT